MQSSILCQRQLTPEWSNSGAAMLCARKQCFRTRKTARRYTTAIKHTHVSWKYYFIQSIFQSHASSQGRVRLIVLFLQDMQPEDLERDCQNVAMKGEADWESVTERTSAPFRWSYSDSSRRRVEDERMSLSILRQVPLRACRQGKTERAGIGGSPSVHMYFISASLGCFHPLTACLLLGLGLHQDESCGSFGNGTAGPSSSPLVRSR